MSSPWFWRLDHFCVIFTREWGRPAASTENPSWNLKWLFTTGIHRRTGYFFSPTPPSPPPSVGKPSGAKLYLVKDEPKTKAINVSMCWTSWEATLGVCVDHFSPFSNICFDFASLASYWRRNVQVRDFINCPQRRDMRGVFSTACEIGYLCSHLPDLLTPPKTPKQKLYFFGADICLCCKVTHSRTKYYKTNFLPVIHIYRGTKKLF